MKLLFSARAIDNMAGGVERMIIALMNAMVERGHDVQLLTFDKSNSKSFYKMSEKIEWHMLNLGDTSRKATNIMRLKRVMKTRDIIKTFSPDVIIGFQDGPFMALRASTIGLGFPVIAAERNAPTRFDHTSSSKKKKMLTFNAFRFAKAVTVQFEAYRDLYPPYLHKKIRHIPNPVSKAPDLAEPSKANQDGRYQLLSVGRLSYQKNYGSLIKAFSKLAHKFPDWDLVIYGDGEEKEELLELINDKELGNRIRLPGKTKTPSSAYCSSNLFCMPSRWEGFPNAVAESLSHGLPVVGFKGCAGVSHLIDDGKYGYLAEGNGNFETLSLELEKLMSDASLRDNMGKNGYEAMQQFRPEKVMDQWEQLFLSLR